MPVDRQRKPTSAVNGAPTNGRTVRCAVYTRKSTDEGLEQEFNSLDAQREAAEAYILSQRHEGWTALEQRYDDGGYTGANMDRPALMQLLADVQAGAVDCVMVYKVDRLTRSLLDFSRIIEVFDKRGVSFVSVTQQFNTTNSLGRLTLNILLSFAQFEREMIAERTRDKMGAARRKGKWVGGNPVLGYDIDPRGGRLLVNEGEADRVRSIFALYLERGALMPVIQELEHRGWRTKEWITQKGHRCGGKPFAKNRLYNLLTNIIYAGKVNYGGQIYEGEHEAIVDVETWDRVQQTLKGNSRSGGHEVRNKYGAILKGLLQCATCNVGMVHTYTRKGNHKLYRYYVCVNAHQRGWEQCETRSVSAPAIEQAVVDQIRGIGRNPALVSEVVRQLAERGTADLSALAQERQAGQHELRRLHEEMKGIITVAASTGTAGRVAIDRLADLQDRSQKLECRLAEIQKEMTGMGQTAVDRREIEEALTNFDPLWQQLSPREQEHLVKALVERVSYDGRNGNVTVGFRSVGIKQMCRQAKEGLS